MAATAGVERALAHQAVHADLGAQPAVGVLALEAHGGGLDAGHVAVGGFHQLGLEAVRLAPAQVHAQQHLGPVLGFGAAGTGLDVQIGVGGVHLAGEHAAEFQVGDHALQALQVRFHFRDGGFVALFHRQFKQIAGVTDALTGLVQGGDDVFQLRALLAQGLGPLGLVPDVRQGQFALYFDQSFALLVVVKDTPSAHRRARPGR